MAIIKVIYNCGCGYRTSKMEEAMKHADSELHVASFQGMVYPEDAVKRVTSNERTTSAVRTRVTDRVVAPVFDSALPDMADFE